MFPTLLDVTAREVAREHKRMLDVLEREATKVATRAAKDIEVAQRLAQLDVEVERLRVKGKDPAR